jgi:hypothetical protein
MGDRNLNYIMHKHTMDDIVYHAANHNSIWSHPYASIFGGWDIEAISLPLMASNYTNSNINNMFCDSICYMYNDYAIDDNIPRSGGNYSRLSRHSRCYILLLDDPTLLKIMCYLAARDIFTSIPKVCHKFHELHSDKYILDNLKNRLYTRTNYLNDKNQIPDELPLMMLYQKLRNIYFNKFDIRYYHKQRGKYYIHGVKTVTIYAGDTIASFENKSWWPKKSNIETDLKFTLGDVVNYHGKSVINNKWYNLRFIDYVWQQKLINDSQNAPRVKWTDNYILYIHSYDKKFYDGAHIEL